jgi:hypothetical protein
VSAVAEQLARRPGAHYLAMLCLVLGLCLATRFVLQTAHMAGVVNQVTRGGPAPQAADALGEDSTGDGLLPVAATATRPVSPSYSVVAVDLYHLPAAPHPIPHPPQFLRA